MAYKIFIDGSEGTTGLKILERFSSRSDIELITIENEKRKDLDARKVCINESDITFLCLPDNAAKEAVSLCQNNHTRIIDSSTAHRTADAWVYGFPELSKKFRESVVNAKQLSVPGCYASGFNAICYPLVASGLMQKDYPVTCHAVSGYSGAGKKGIAQYEEATKSKELDAPRLYALSQEHKHLAEMQKISMLNFPPIFMPYICNYFSGMTVTIPLYTRMLSKKIHLNEIYELFLSHYDESFFVKVMPLKTEELSNQYISANTLSGTNFMHLYIYGNDERVIVTAQFD
ncbi:MAG: N-acetyl-gamma-glutamyl-phosphate reductase, partial [Treponema sp.]|nr:N-acetyl-gamma-glutamyl-phosphate reductase [Treponema sp.]